LHFEKIKNYAFRKDKQQRAGSVISKSGSGSIDQNPSIGYLGHVYSNYGLPAVL
jgi:hypothetical protein